MHPRLRLGRRVLRRARARPRPATAGRPERTASEPSGLPSGQRQRSSPCRRHEQRRIPAEFVDEKAAGSSLASRGSRSPPWCRRGWRSPAAVGYPATRMTGTSGRARETHVGDIVGRRLTSEAPPAPSTSTRSASRPSRPIAVEHERQQIRLQASDKRRRLGGPVNAPLHHTICAPISLCGLSSTGSM